MKEKKEQVTIKIDKDKMVNQVNKFRLENEELKEMYENVRAENVRIYEELEEYKKLRLELSEKYNKLKIYHHQLEDDHEHLKHTMQTTQNMLNFAKWQVDVYQRMTGTRDEDLCTTISLDCNQDCCNED